MEMELNEPTIDLILKLTAAAEIKYSRTSPALNCTTTTTTKQQNFTSESQTVV